MLVNISDCNFFFLLPSLVITAYENIQGVRIRFTFRNAIYFSDEMYLYLHFLTE